MPLYGPQGLCPEAHNAFRFKRIYVRPEFGVPFLSSSDIISMRPEIDRFLSKAISKRLDDLLIGVGRSDFLFRNYRQCGLGFGYLYRNGPFARCHSGVRSSQSRSPQAT